ncbi:MAG: hypothetical protein IKD61_09210 [Oscillospiraceae bacterium]|nr:hypothetical protein [Oscillospiraceae bacterium]
MELKTCPFCAGLASYAQKSTGSGNGTVNIGFIIWCSKCGTTAPGSEGLVELSLNGNGELRTLRDDRERCAKAWNKRGGE